MTRVSLLNEDGLPIGEILYGQPFTVAVEYEVEKPIDDAVFWAGISSAADETPVLTSSSTDFGGSPMSVEPGRFEVRVRFDVALLPSEFAIDVGVSKGHETTIDGVERVMTFSAHRRAAPGEEPYPWEQVVGYARADAKWTLPSPATALTPEPSRAPS